MVFYLYLIVLVFLDVFALFVERVDLIYVCRIKQILLMGGRVNWCMLNGDRQNMLCVLIAQIWKMDAFALCLLCNI